MKKLLSIILALAMLLSVAALSTLVFAETGIGTIFSEDESEDPGSEVTDPTEPENPGGEENEPTDTPEPSEEPTPSVSPSESPSASPSEEPSASPSEEPSGRPSEKPSVSSSADPSSSPSASPTKKPTPTPKRVNRPVEVFSSMVNASSAAKKNAAKNAAYISGYNDGTFKPDEKVTRAETMAMLARLSADFDENKTYPSKFPDVTPGSWNYNYIGFAESKNLASGYEDGSFMPYRTITRAEFAVIITNFAGLGNVNGTGTAMPFNDVMGHWAYGRIQVCYKNGYINGYNDGTFRPNEPISRVEAVSIINKVIGRSASNEKTNKNTFTDIPQNYWGYGNIMAAANGVQ